MSEERGVRGDTPQSIGIGARPTVPKPQSWGGESGAVAPLTLEELRALEVRCEASSTSILRVEVTQLDRLIEAAKKGMAAPSSPTVDPLYMTGGLRERLASLAVDRSEGYVAAIEDVLEVIDEEKAKAEAAVALLQEPRVGMRVVGPGFVATYRTERWAPSPWWAFAFGDYSATMSTTNADPFLVAQVSSGAAYVTEGEA